ncbi:sphingomyelin phosphodiesterase [Shewanella sp. VB17]|uniref:sphingomyelin phosphodiesterase n=1 Tax=Shewanella sp. VB17 TaxID=2739432 RepID=UPI001565F8F0|nr:sphingomyelin phosphodiesterase [Shewanella sp. VB17]NRD74086.1 sphingomyelin phosphodiesterase [Shewanella sp. VB17]
MPAVTYLDSHYSFLSRCINGFSVLFSLLIFSPALLADTDIYVTNNSAAQMTIDVSHTGSDRLEEGSEWIQQAQILGPWESQLVLSINRWEGVKNNHKYQFETQLTNEDGQYFTLHQEVEGHRFSSTLKHGVSTADIALLWKNDREIHRVQSMIVAEQPIELALKASKTARYDDIYYTVTPIKQPPVANDDADVLSVMTYNIWALPLIASKISERFSLLPEQMQGYDVLLLQEVFAAGRDGFLRQLADEYPYQTRMLNKPGMNIHDGGVTILSRFPIVNQSQYIFPDCAGTDCFADKGVNYAEVIKNGKAYHVFATHTASYDTDIARDYRQRQFQQIHQFAADLNIPATETVIYGGDFNVNKRKFEHDYLSMLAHLEADEPQYTGYTESTFDPRINAFAGKVVADNGNVEYLDYILVSNQHGIKKSNRNTVHVPRSTAAQLWGDWNLSDHFPVGAEIF